MATRKATPPPAAPAKPESPAALPPLPKVPRFLVMQRMTGELVLVHEQDITPGYVGFDYVGTKQVRRNPHDVPMDEREIGIPGGSSKAGRLSKRIVRPNRWAMAALRRCDAAILRLVRKRQELIVTAYGGGDHLLPVELFRLAERNRKRPSWNDGTGGVYHYKQALEPKWQVFPRELVTKAYRRVGGDCSVHGWSATPGCPGCAETVARKAVS
jgi:hypothetical protein